MKTKLVVPVLAVLSAVSFIGFGVAAYFVIDQAVSLTYMSASVESCVRDNRNLESLLETEWRGLSREVIRKKLEGTAAGHPRSLILVKQEDGVLSFDSTQFQFESDRLQKVGPR